MVSGTAARSVAVDWPLFSRQLSNTLHYWLAQAEQLARDWAAFDAEARNIARVVEYGLQVPETCVVALRLAAATRQPILRRASAVFGDNLVDLLARAARRVPHGAGHDVEIATTLEMAGQLYQRRGRIAEAERCFREGLVAAGSALRPDLLAHVQAELGRFLVECERPAEGLPLLEQALALAERHANRPVAARVLLALGWYHHHVWDGAASEKYLLRALPIVEELGEPNHLCRVWLDLANAHWRMGDYERAQADCARAMEYAGRSGDVRMRALTTSMIGALHCDCDRFDAAVEFLHDAEHSYQQLDLRYDLANVYMSLSAAYWGLQLWAPSKHYAESAVAFWRMLGQELLEVEALFNLVEIQLDSGASEPVAALLAAARSGLERQAAAPGLDHWRRRMRERLCELELRVNT